MRGRDSNDGSQTTDYFKVGGEPLGERTAKWINDDYVKFLRLGERLVERAGLGIVGYVTNHSWIDNPTFRGVRAGILGLFRHLEVLDLHGNSTKKERAPDGGKDENVFDIKQGVAISLLSRPLPADLTRRVLWGELWGNRDQKYQALAKTRASERQELYPQPPNYLLVPQDVALKSEYGLGISVVDMFPLKGHGVITKRDNLAVHFTADEAWSTVSAFATCPPLEAYRTFALPEDVRDWSVQAAQRDLVSTGPSRDLVRSLCYRPFNKRYTYYTGRARGFIGWPVDKVMRHMLAGPNIALIATRQTKDQWGVFVAGTLIGHKACSAYDINTVFPLFLTDESVTGLFRDSTGRSVNLDPQSIAPFDQVLGARVLSEEGARRLGVVSGAQGLFGYLYAVFYSAQYRTRYAQFLNTEYPRVPIPKSEAAFRRLAGLGSELVALHLLEGRNADRSVCSYVGPRNALVSAVEWVADTVWIQLEGRGDRQRASPERPGFRGVSAEVWKFRVGGYQVCDKWLKDRKGRRLSNEDVAQFESIVDAVAASIRLMKEIDVVIGEQGGWSGTFNVGAAEMEVLPMAAETLAEYSPDA